MYFQSGVASFTTAHFKYCFFFMIHYSTNTTPVVAGIAFHSDADIMSLDRTDLHEILPGPDNLRVRKAIFGMIDRQVKLQNTHGGNLVTVCKSNVLLGIFF